MQVLHEKQMQMMEAEYEMKMDELMAGPVTEDFFCQVT